MDFAYDALEWTVGHGGKDGSLPLVAASGDHPPEQHSLTTQVNALKVLSKVKGLP